MEDNFNENNQTPNQNTPESNNPQNGNAEQNSHTPPFEYGNTSTGGNYGTQNTNTPNYNYYNNNMNNPNYGGYNGQSNSYSTSPNGNSYNNQQYGSFNGNNQNGNYSAPFYGNNNNNSNNNNNDKKGSAGKAVFAIIICICVVIASIGIGSALKGNNTAKPSKSTTEKNEESKKNEAPKLNSGASADKNTADVANGDTLSQQEIYEKVKDINVGVKVYSNSQQTGEGSGIIASCDGTYTYIITCAHVISSKNDVQVEFNNGNEIDADIVGFDTKTDVGVLKIKKTGLKTAEFADSDSLKVGSNVYAIGNPGGSEFFGTFTNGMVTAIDRPVNTSNSAYDLPCIQHNAAINPGNSGGALVNGNGEVVGLNSSKIASTEYEGMGFSVPANTVKEIYSDIAAHGYVKNRPMLGITYYAVSSNYTYSAIAWKNNLPYGSIVIQNIAEGSSFDGTDVEIGDIITSVNGKKLESTDILLDVIENAKVGDTLTLGICRLNNNGSVNKNFTAKVTLVEDKGNNIVETTPTEQNTEGFEYYFPFGY